MLAPLGLVAAAPAAAPPYAPADHEPPPYSMIPMQMVVIRGGRRAWENVSWPSLPEPDCARAARPHLRRCEPTLQFDKRWFLLLLVVPVTMGAGLGATYGLLRGPKARFADCLTRFCAEHHAALPSGHMPVDFGVSPAFVSAFTKDDAAWLQHCQTPGFIATWVGRGHSVGPCEGTGTLRGTATACVAAATVCSLALVLGVLVRKAAAVRAHNMNLRLQARRSWSAQ